VWSRRTTIWIAATLPAFAFMAVTARGPLAGASWVAPRVLFWFVLVVASLCAIGAGVVLAVGWRRRLAELAVLGAALSSLSVLSIAHGVTTPGVLYGANPATAAAAFLAVPFALFAAAPVLLPDSTMSRALGRAWRAWTVAAPAASTGLAALLLARPGSIPVPAMGSPLALVVMAAALAGCLALSWRHLRLYRLGLRPASLVASVGFGHLGASTIVWAAEGPFSLGFWGAHVIDAAGVLTAAAGLALAHRRDRSLAAMLAPVVNRDPLIALELGLTPTVHRFVAALEQKDPITREHVVRVGELAMRAGVRAGLAPERLRAVGLAALLHDVGKLFTPDDILTKPGRLTDDEFAEIKRHTVDGEQLMRSSPLLAPAADLVRWHHERADGTGYPDGLRAGELPAEVGILSVCDAWDAMTFSRHYRAALSEPDALEILREGAGSQWTTAAVELVSAELAAGGAVVTPRFAGIGRADANDHEQAAVCREVIPEAARRRLAPSPAA